VLIVIQQQVLASNAADLPLSQDVTNAESDLQLTGLFRHLLLDLILMSFVVVHW